LGTGKFADRVTPENNQEGYRLRDTRGRLNRRRNTEPSEQGGNIWSDSQESTGSTGSDDIRANALTLSNSQNGQRSSPLNRRRPSNGANNNNATVTANVAVECVRGQKRGGGLGKFSSELTLNSVNGVKRMKSNHHEI
jgi:hypothetical protein